MASKGISVNSNYLGEKHGKFGRDQHFSVISYFLRKESFKNLITNTTDIANAINSYQNQSNRFRRTQFKEDLEVFAFVLNPNVNEIYKKNTRLIHDLTSFYNLQNIEIDNEYFLNSTVYSDLNDLIDPRFLNSVVEEERGIVNYQGPSEIEEEQLNIDSYLKHKRQTIEILLKSVQKTPSRTISINNINQIMNSDTRTSGASSSIITDIPTTSNRIEQAIDSSPLQTPKFCSANCTNCMISPLYSVEQLKTVNSNRRLIGQIKINEELSRHSHPKSRKIKNKLRNTEQALSELLEHYYFVHKLV